MLNPSIKILVTGSDGQTGMSLRDIVKEYPECKFIFVNKKELDIIDLEAIQNLFQKYKFDYCINLAAYTAVDKAETEQEKAYSVNALGAGNIAIACRESNCILIHISTDFVFDGEKQEPYIESDTTNPIGVYGLTKFQGEQLALKENSKTIIIRTSWVYSEYGHNFVKTMLRLAKEKDELRVVNDQYGSPTYTRSLIKVIMKIVRHDKNKLNYGVYHYADKGMTNWYEFARIIIEEKELPCKVIPIPTSEYPTPAKRPKYSILNTKKIIKEFNVDIPDWKDRLKECLSKIED